VLACGRRRCSPCTPPAAKDGIPITSRARVELDGYTFHSDRQAFERDRLRDSTLQAAGWRAVA
jgi:very-short-patch-repair endonuclease